MREFLFVTANLNEKEAFEKLFKPNTALDVYIKGQKYFHGKFGKYDIAYIHIDKQGASSSATQLVEKLIEKIKPIAVVMVGIAFGRDENEQKIGEVLVSDLILPYDSKKFLEKTIDYKETPKESGFHLIHAFNSWSKDWKETKIHVGAILTGSTLVNNYEYRTKLLEDFKQYNPIGGEMEAYGIYSACRMNGIPEWIIIKGICDWGYKKNTPAKEHDQKIAAKAAVNFCHKVFCSNAFKELCEVEGIEKNNTKQQDTEKMLNNEKQEKIKDYSLNTYPIHQLAFFPKMPEYKILLVRTAIKHPINDEDFGVPLNLYVLKDYLKTTGHNLIVDIWDERLELKKIFDKNELEECKKENKLFKKCLNDGNYDAVGISMCTAEVIPALKKFKIVKSEHKDIITFCGGIFTTSNEKCLLEAKSNEKNLIDYVIPGMATKPLGDLLVQLYQQKESNINSLANVYGVAHNNNIGHFKVPWSCSQLPTMQLSMWQEIICKYEHHLDGKIGIYTARGCNRGCLFCSVQKESKQVIFRRNDNCVIDEINYLKEQGFNYFSFKDEDFLLNKGIRIEKILERVKDTNVKFKIRARYDEVSALLDKDTNFLKKLKNMGIDEIQYGIETYSRNIRDHVFKKYEEKLDSEEKIGNFIKKHSDNGITANCSFIFGILGENIEYYDKLLEFMKSIYNVKSSNPKIYLNYLTPHPYNSQFTFNGTHHLVTDDLNYFTHRYPVCYAGDKNVALNEKMFMAHNEIARETKSEKLNPPLDEETLKNKFINNFKKIDNGKVNLNKLIDED